MEALLDAWNADDWERIHPLIATLTDHEGLKTLRWIDQEHGLLFYRITSLYWQALAEYWQDQAERSAEGIDTVLHRLFELDTYNMGEQEQQEYRAWLREQGPCPEVIGWDTDPAWFAWPDISGFVQETLEATPYRREQERRAIAAMAKPA